MFRGYPRVTPFRSYRTNLRLHTHLSACGKGEKEGGRGRERARKQEIDEDKEGERDITASMPAGPFNQEQRKKVGGSEEFRSSKLVCDGARCVNGSTVGGRRDRRR